VTTGEIPPSRLLNTSSNAWFAVGPVAVFEIAGVAPAHASAAILVAALAAQFAVDFAAVVVREAITRGTDLATLLRETWVYAVDAALSGVGLVVARDASPAAVLTLVPLLGLLSLFGHERRRRLEGLLELGSAYRGTALVLGDVVEADDGYTGKHCKSVVALALEVADVLSLDAQRRRNLEFGALLHDVGKIAIPKEIINKPGKLDAAEWTVIKTHTLEGQKMLERVGGFMREVGLIVRSHHERWDGGGYPDGLAGERIPLEARIIACCDTWNAMRTDRAYRNALSHEVALAELKGNSGSQFDPTVVEALLKVIEPAPGSVPIKVDDARPGLPSPGVAMPSQAA
jgi:putative nucleotidyltransferase with HDIG domain